MKNRRDINMKNQKWKADEMEIAINYRAMRIAFVFSRIALLAYCIYEYVALKRLPTIPFVIFCVQGILFFSSKIFITSKMTKESDDEE